MKSNKFLYIEVFFFVILLNFSEFYTHPIDIIYTGENCCQEHQKLPFAVSIPCKQTFIPLPKHHGYNIEIPLVEKKDKFECKLDFNVQTPIKPCLPFALKKTLSAKVDKILLPGCPPTPKIPPTPKLPTELVFAVPTFGFPFNLPQPRYLFNNLETFDLEINSIREKRDVLKNTKENDIFNFYSQIKETPYSLKKEPNKLKITKRSINEFNSLNNKPLNKNSSKKRNYEVPEILQFMPEVSLPNFQPGKCFACQQPQPNLHSPIFAHQFSCQPTVTPVNIDLPPIQYYDISTLPNLYQSKISGKNKNVEEKLNYNKEEQKYKQNNKGNLKQIQSNKKKFNYNEEKFNPIVGKILENDPEMENLLKQILENHQDFIKASDHGEGILTESPESQRHDINVFLRRLLNDRIFKWIQHRKTRVFENLKGFDSLNDDSLERLQRSLEQDYVIKSIPSTTNQKYLIKLIPKSKDNKNKLSKIAQTMKDQHVVKFRKNGKIFQLIVSPETKYEEKKEIVEESFSM